VRLPTLNPDRTSPLTLRRLTITAVGAVAVLALSGSQTVRPASVAFVSAAAEPQEGQSYYYDANAMWSGAPDVTTQTTGFAPVAAVTSTKPGPYGLTTPATLTSSGIPQAAYNAYISAANALATSDPSCKISWSLIAGIGRVESNHGRFGGSSITASGLVVPPILGIKLDGSRAGTARISDSDNGKYDGDTVTDRAVGPMQFLPATWKVYGGGADPQNMNAAALATGKYLCAGGGVLDTQKGRWAAVYRYNHSDSYVSLVLSLADAYASGTVTTFPSRPAGTSTDDDAPGATPTGPPPSLPPVPPITTPPPTVSPITTPSGTPTTTPAKTPTKSPTASPTASPTGSNPTSSPTPTSSTDPTSTPTGDPTSSTGPTSSPSPTLSADPTATLDPTDAASASASASTDATSTDTGSATAGGNAETGTSGARR
jgi:membrane-bound lytic murein transglycosylase B